MRLQRLPVLGQHRLADPRDQALIGEVDAIDLDLRGFLVQQAVQFLLAERPDRLVRVEQPAAAEDAPVPAVHAVTGNRDRALVDRLGVVIELGEIEIADRAESLAARAHPAEAVERRLDRPRRGPALDRDRAARADRRDVERVRTRRADVRLAQPAEQDPQHRAGVGGGADRGSRIGAHALLIHDDRRGQPLQHVDVRAGQRGHEALHERAVGLVDQPLRFGGDGGEHQ